MSEERLERIENKVDQVITQVTELRVHLPTEYATKAEVRRGWAAVATVLTLLTPLVVVML